MPFLTDRADHHFAWEASEGELQKDLFTGLIAIGCKYFDCVVLVDSCNEIFGCAVVRAYFSQ